MSIQSTPVQSTLTCGGPMSTQQLRDALHAVGTEASLRVLVRIVQFNEIFPGEGLPEVAKECLEMLCHDTTPPLARRWIGLLLCKLAQASDAVVEYLKGGPVELKQIGPFMLEPTQPEVTRIVLGVFILNVLTRGVGFKKLWPTPWIPNNSVFPQVLKGDGSTWLMAFQSWIDQLHDLKLGHFGNDSTMLFPISMSLEGGFSAIMPVAILQDGKLTLIVPGNRLRTLELLDFTLWDINMERAKATLHNPEGLPTDHDAQQITISSKLGWMCRWNEGYLTDYVRLIFKDRDHADHFEACIRESIRKGVNSVRASTTVSGDQERESLPSSPSEQQQPSDAVTEKGKGRGSGRGKRPESSPQESPLPLDTVALEPDESKGRSKAMAGSKSDQGFDEENDTLGERKGAPLPAARKTNLPRVKKAEPKKKATPTASQKLNEDIYEVPSDDRVPTQTGRKAKRAIPPTLESGSVKKRKTRQTCKENVDSKEKGSSKGDSSAHDSDAPGGKKEVRRSARLSKPIKKAIKSKLSNKKTAPVRRKQGAESSIAVDKRNLREHGNQDLGEFGLTLKVSSSIRLSRLATDGIDSGPSSRLLLHPSGVLADDCPTQWPRENGDEDIPQLISETPQTPSRPSEQSTLRQLNEVFEDLVQPAKKAGDSRTTDPLRQSGGKADRKSEHLTTPQQYLSKLSSSKRKHDLPCELGTPKRAKKSHGPRPSINMTGKPLIEPSSPSVRVRCRSAPSAARKPPTIKRPNLQGSLLVDQHSMRAINHLSASVTAFDQIESGQTPVQRSLQRTSSLTSATAEVLSSNSKPVPASPNAESTAISGHAVHGDMDVAKELGDLAATRSDPFTRPSQESDHAKRTKLYRRLTGEKVDVTLEATVGAPQANTTFDEGQNFDGSMDVDEDVTLAAPDEPESLPTKATTIDYPSSPPKRFLLPSSHSSMFAAASQPLGHDIDPAVIEAEDEEWEASLKPHQHAIGEQLSRITKRVFQYNVDSEVAVDNVADLHAEDGKKIIGGVRESGDKDIEGEIQGLQKRRKVMKKDYEVVAKGLAKEKKRIEKVPEWLATVSG